MESETAQLKCCSCGDFKLLLLFITEADEVFHLDFVCNTCGLCQFLQVPRLLNVQLEMQTQPKTKEKENERPTK